MSDIVKKYIRQSIIYILVILVSWLILYPSLIINYAFNTLPIIYTLLFIINVIIVVLFIQQLIKFRNELIKIMAKQNKENDEDAENESIEKDEISEETVELGKHLLKGITKKTAKKVFTEKLLSNLVKHLEAAVGVYYTYNKKAKAFQVASTYAYFSDEQPPDFKVGEGINGQVVKNKKAMLIKDTSQSHIKVVSGLGKGKPKFLFIMPVVLDDKVIALIELASFTRLTESLESELSKFFEANRDKFLNIDEK